MRVDLLRKIRETSETTETRKLVSVSVPSTRDLCHTERQTERERGRKRDRWNLPSEDCH